MNTGLLNTLGFRGYVSKLLKKLLRRSVKKENESYFYGLLKEIPIPFSVVIIYNKEVLTHADGRGSFNTTELVHSSFINYSTREYSIILNSFLKKDDELFIRYATGNKQNGMYSTEILCEDTKITDSLENKDTFYYEAIEELDEEFPGYLES